MVDESVRFGQSIGVYRDTYRDIYRGIPFTSTFIAVHGQRVIREFDGEKGVGKLEDLGPICPHDVLVALPRLVRQLDVDGNFYQRLVQRFALPAQELILAHPIQRIAVAHGLEMVVI